MKAVPSRRWGFKALDDLGDQLVFDNLIRRARGAIVIVIEVVAVFALKVS